MTLHLPLHTCWFDGIAAGHKRIEYRKITPYWTTRLWNKRDKITHVCFSRGYTRERITRKVTRIDTGPCPYPGWSGNYYRIHFEVK